MKLLCFSDLFLYKDKREKVSLLLGQHSQSQLQFDEEPIFMLCWKVGDVITAFVPWKETSKWQRWLRSHLILPQSYHWLSLATEWLDTKHPEASDFGRITAKDFVWTKQNILVVSTQNRWLKTPCIVIFHATFLQTIDSSTLLNGWSDWKPIGSRCGFVSDMVLFQRILPLGLHILDFLGCKPYLEGFGVQGYKYWSSSFVTET